MVYNNAAYYYQYNMQGDVTQLVDATGNVVVEYTYSPWGAVTVSGTMKDTVGAANPFRYRGYYYDAETGLYYLNSRYYDPQTHRFVNQDVFVSTEQGFNGLNMMIYCNNNPISFLDIDGCWTYSISLAGSASALVGVGGSIGLAMDTNGNIGIIASYSFPVDDSYYYGALLGVSAGWQYQWTNADKIYNLTQDTTVIGASGNIDIAAIGLDVIGFGDMKDNDQIDGIQLFGGAGLGVEMVHLEKPQTKVLWSINVFGTENKTTQNTVKQRAKRYAICDAYKLLALDPWW